MKSYAIKKKLAQTRGSYMDIKDMATHCGNLAAVAFKQNDPTAAQKWLEEAKTWAQKLPCR